MGSYLVNYGEYITDAVLNKTGNISNWNAILDGNPDIDTWTPDLYAGQVLNIPDGLPLNNEAIAALTSYPANNHSVPDIYAQIQAVYDIMLTATPVPIVLPPPAVIDTNKYYVVQWGETIADVVLNATGNFDNWNLIMNANGFVSWVPELYPGQLIAIPIEASISQNAQRALATYPANNHSVPDIYEQIAALGATINDAWILTTGFWDDSKYWKDNRFWID